MASRLKGAGLLVDCGTANRQVEAWLSEVANCRVHATTQARPVDLWREEVERLLPLPERISRDWAPLLGPPSARPIPLESVQHPLSVYEALLAVTA